jgi:ribosomal protein S18 acetylase RimI-like enzyme
LGNRILSRFENAALGHRLSEFHSGYRAYSVSALKQLPFEKNSDGFNFDTQIIIQLHDAGMRIAEVPIPTYYGDEICYVDGMGYAADVTKDVITYRLQKAGFGDGSRIALTEEYQLKPSEDSSHGRISKLLAHRPPSRILDLGCSSGLLSERLLQDGPPRHRRRRERDRRGARTHGAFFKADLNEGIPSEVGTGFDIVLAADVIEHVMNPSVPDGQIRESPEPHGTALFCVPNIAHWYPRFRSTLGMFDYDQRGILDTTHLRFFTRRSLGKLIERGRGFAIRRIEPVGLPLDAVGVDGTKAAFTACGCGGPARAVRCLWPTMFGYQFIVEATPVAAALYRAFLWRDGPLAALECSGRLLRSWRRAIETLRHGTEGGGKGAELLAIAVDPAAQGRGAGALLVRGFLSEIQQRGQDAAHVVVAAGNDRAIALYQRAGFLPVERFALHAGAESVLMQWATGTSTRL